MKYRINTLPLIVFISFLLACSTNEPLPQPPIEYDTAELIVRNYFTDDAAFDFRIDNTAISTEVAYGGGGKGIFKWDSAGDGVLNFSINTSTTETVVFSIGLKAEKDKSYYFCMLGPVTDGWVTLVENNLVSPQAGNARIRFLHAYHQNIEPILIEPIDIYIGGSTVDFKLITGLNYTELSTTFEVSVLDLSTMIICTETGVLPDPATDLYRNEGSTTHEEGKIYLNALASATIDPTSEFSLFVTEQ